MTGANMSQHCMPQSQKYSDIRKLEATKQPPFLYSFDNGFIKQHLLMGMDGTIM